MRTRLVILLLLVMPSADEALAQVSRSDSLQGVYVLAEIYGPDAEVPLPDSGVYYAFRGRALENGWEFRPARSPEKLVRSLLAAGVRPTHLWYKNGASSCAVVSDGLALQIVMMSQFVVRLEQTSAEMRRLGYELISPEGAGLRSGCQNISTRAYLIP